MSTPSPSTSTTRRQTPEKITAAAMIAAAKVMPKPALDSYLGALSELQCVADVRWTVRRRRKSPERYPQRNAEIRERHAKGETYGELAMVYGLSRGRICKIIHAGRSKSVSVEATEARSQCVA